MITALVFWLLADLQIQPQANLPDRCLASPPSRTSPVIVLHCYNEAFILDAKSERLVTSAVPNDAILAALPNPDGSKVLLWLLNGARLFAVATDQYTTVTAPQLTGDKARPSYAFWDERSGSVFYNSFTSKGLWRWDVATGSVTMIAPDLPNEAVLLAVKSDHSAAVYGSPSGAFAFDAASKTVKQIDPRITRRAVYSSDETKLLLLQTTKSGGKLELAVVEPKAWTVTRRSPTTLVETGELLLAISANDAYAYVGANGYLQTRRALEAKRDVLRIDVATGTASPVTWRQPALKRAGDRVRTLAFGTLTGDGSVLYLPEQRVMRHVFSGDLVLLPPFRAEKPAQLGFGPDGTIFAQNASFRALHEEPSRVFELTRAGIAPPAPRPTIGDVGRPKPPRTPVFVSTKAGQVEVIESPGTTTITLKAASGSTRVLSAPGNVRVTAALSGSLFVAGLDDGGVCSCDAEAARCVAKLAHSRMVSNLIVEPGGRRFVSAAFDRRAIVWDASTFTPIVTVFNADDAYAIVTPDGYLMTIGDIGDSVSVRVGGRAYRIEQLERAINRPDIVLARLGSAPEALITRLKGRVLRRFEKAGLDTSLLVGKPTVDSLPTARFDEGELGLPTNRNEVVLHLSLTSVRGLRTLHATVDGVPVAGVDGTAVSGSALTQTFTVPLAAGINRVRAWATDAYGMDSIPALHIVEKTGSTKPDLYLVTMGVSRYRDAQYDLRYAAKDARDMADAIGKHHDRFARVLTLTLTDAEVTKGALARIEAHIGRAKIDDAVLLFAAGHGIVDDKGGYFFATHDMSFERPEQAGISFDELSALWTTVKARRRALLLDTCHAGETDEEELARRSVAMPTSLTIASRGVKLNADPRRAINAAYTELIARDLFSDASRDTGANVLASSQGVEYAIESGAQKNGVFTHALRVAIEYGNGDLDGDRIVALSELFLHILDDVRRESAGLQTPTVRQFNPDGDFAIRSARRD